MYHMTVRNNQVDEGRLGIEAIKLNLGQASPTQGCGGWIST